MRLFFQPPADFKDELIPVVSELVMLVSAMLIRILFALQGAIQTLLNLEWVLL